MIQLKYKTISTTLERSLWELITLPSENDSAAGQQNFQLSVFYWATSHTEVSFISTEPLPFIELYEFTKKQYQLLTTTF